MTDFQKALASLKMADISIITPTSSIAPPPPRHSPRIRRSIRRTRDHDAGADNSNPETTSTNDTASPPVTADAAPKSVAADASTKRVKRAKPTHTRQRIEHVWPPEGTIVSGNYFGTVYRAQVVKANKNLKSGRQLKLLDSPCKGRRFDSFTKALLVATTRQRKESNFGRRQASNGWEFWAPEAPGTVPTAGVKASG